MVDPRTLVVIKCLKPVSERKIRREIMILERASKVPNLVRLVGIVLSSEYYARHRRYDTDLHLYNEYGCNVKNMPKDAGLDK